jgi:hypothetical protein
MKKLLFLLTLLPSFVFSQTHKQRKAQEKADAITLADITAHIKYLASDSLEGRRTGTRGELLAMKYISAQFQKDGLQPEGTTGYMQEFTIDEGKQFDSVNNSFAVNGHSLLLNTDFYPLAFSSNAQAKGAASPGLSEKGSPWFWDAKDVLDDNKQNPHFDINEAILQQAKDAAKKGASALIVCNSSSLVDNIQFNKRDTSATVSIPVVYVSQDALKKYFGDATAFYTIAMQVKLSPKSRKARNVIGYINNGAANTVIIGAHYDHLGYGEDGNSLDGFGKIHNGADDNASGTAALIELGRIFKNDVSKNNNYLFIAFSGEELGLLGSKYWLDHETINITPNYMINMDMVGRYDSARKLTIGGFGTSPEWDDLFKTTPDKNLVVHFDSSGSGPSDHESFYLKNIPVLFFFTNSHPDYHKATDDWEKINFAGEVEIIDYIRQLIDVLNDKGKLAFLKTRDEESRPIALPVTLGVVPDYAYSGAGLRIDGVSKGKIAERIGLQSGDVLLQLGDYKFSDIHTYMHALKQFKKGDKTTLRIMRGTEEKTFDVQF